MRIAIVVSGTVQGVGFRPHARRAALARELVGWVQNRRDSVRIEVQGTESAVMSFARALVDDLPPPAQISNLEIVPLEDSNERGFRILESDAAASAAPVLPPDLAICPACWREVRAHGERRHGYPFTNCAQCGPRYSIAGSLPYDRRNTSMHAFPLCPACRREYGDLDDRRYHAQAIACPECGPSLVWLDGSGRALERGPAALARAASSLGRGEIVALLGVGGFQLLTDARQSAPVSALRSRKRRPHKPFAVMFRDLGQLEQFASLSGADRRVLTSPAAPIVIVPRREGAELAPEVAPGMTELGAMLPYTALHGLLLDDAPSPLVCTSGNRRDEPICTRTDEALGRLAGLADGFLSHDRPIVRPLDDSVVRTTAAGKTRVLRRARGYAPLSVGKTRAEVSVLALGAHLKNSVALAHRGSLIMSQHVGDLDSLEARQLHVEVARGLCRFFDARPDVVACDLHPDYPATRLAEQLALEWQVPLLRVQHHHAHVAAVVAEHGLNAPVLGLAWDGTGHGSDGTAWGGEALVCEGNGFTRLAHLAPFPLPGADRAAREPRRAALGALFAFAPEALESLAAPWFREKLPLLVAGIERRINSPRSSSMGRLFDAIAALLGVADDVTFEGQAAMALEQRARAVASDGGYTLPLLARGDGTWQVDATPLFRQLLDDGARNVSVERRARRFHDGLIELGLRAAELAGVQDVALSGGCFQNQLLVDGLHERLRRAGFSVYSPEAVPVNDAGICVGQAWLGAR